MSIDTMCDLMDYKDCAKYCAAKSITCSEIRDIWIEFGDIPINPESECIEATWREFPVGTHREEIWHWFEETFHVRVYDLMYSWGGYKMKKSNLEENELDFPLDEVKSTVKWQKGYDFMDGTPRYTFEHRDPSTTYERFQVVIYVEDKKYYGHVRDNKLEYCNVIGPFNKLADAKAKTLSLFNDYITNFLLDNDS